MLGKIRCNNTLYIRIIKYLKVENCWPECLTASIEIYVYLSYDVP